MNVIRGKVEMGFVFLCVGEGWWVCRDSWVEVIHRVKLMNVDTNEGLEGEYRQFGYCYIGELCGWEWV